jgi:hypothetical protein
LIEAALESIPDAQLYFILFVKALDFNALEARRVTRQLRLLDGDGTTELYEDQTQQDLGEEIADDK